MHALQLTQRTRKRWTDAERKRAYELVFLEGHTHAEAAEKIGASNALVSYWIQAEMEKERGRLFGAHNPPKNGHYYVFQCVGGQTRTYTKLRDRLADTWGVEVTAHIPIDNLRRAASVPYSRADAVLFMTGESTHKLYHMVKESCKAEGVPLLPFNKSIASQDYTLEWAGLERGRDLSELRRKSRQEEAPVEEAPVEEAPTPAPMQVEVVHVRRGLAELAPTEAPLGVATPEIGALAAALQQLCARQRVAVLVTPTELTITTV